MAVAPSHRRRRRVRRLLPSVAVIALVTLFSPFVTALPATAGADDSQTSPVLMEFTKTANPAPPGVVEPGETVGYTLTVTCSSTETICIDATVVDQVPEPLVLQSVIASGRTAANVAIDVAVATDLSTNSFTVEALEQDGDLTGLGDGTEITIQVTALLPTTVSSDFDGQTLVNTATLTVSNREELPDLPNTLTAEASVLLDIAQVLGSLTTKNAMPESMPAVEGRSVDFALTAQNTSNRSVDKLIIQEPADLLSTTLDFVEITGISELSLPDGADRVRVDWYSAVDGDWVEGTAAATATFPVVPVGDEIRGLRIVFSSTTGQVEQGAIGGITIEGELTATAAADDGPQNLSNTASSWVGLGETETAPVPGQDSVIISPPSIGPVATKQFESTYVIGGVLERVTIGGQNGGDFPLSSMTLTEPAPGSTSLADQGISFDSWVTEDIEWPIDATSAVVTYRYVGVVDPDVIVENEIDTLPPPAQGFEVESIQVQFVSTEEGGMTPGQFAVLPFLVQTDAVVDDLTNTNEVRVDVVTLDNDDAFAVASDELTRRTVRVNTSVDKVFSPDELYSIAGATTLVSLPSRVNPLPTAAVDPTSSTIGSESLVITDPVNPQVGGSDPFWNHFDLTNIVATAVPANTDLTIEYYDVRVGVQDWVVLRVDEGPTFVNESISPALRDHIGGIRFTYEHRVDGSLLAPGFNAVPYLRFALRDQLRDNSGDAASGDRTTNLALDNTVQTVVTNETATPESATATGDDQIVLLPTDDGTGGGPGGSIVAIDKTWQSDQVNARSADQATVRINWGTAGTPFDSVVLSDAATDPENTPVRDTVFEAFDLVRVPAITSGMDPLLTFDRVTAVQLFLPGSGPGTGWVDATNDPCPASCDGTFPGYTLTDAESAAATGVRLIIDESPTRAFRIGTNPAAPAVDSGVASSMALDRRFDLVFELRDVRRSDPTVAVLGQLRGAIYNAGSEAGVVNNTATIDGRSETDEVLLTRSASDTILVLDQPILVSVSKSWDDADGALGTPPAGTPAEFYPRARMTIVAENESQGVRVNEMSIIDPVNSTDPFASLNLVDIVTITVPTGATDTTVYLQHGSDPTPTAYERQQALDLLPEDLLDVVGIEVVHTGRIEVSATARLVIDTQLRDSVRGSDPAVSVPEGTVVNTVRARVEDPGGTCAPGPECTELSTIVHEAIDTDTVDIDLFEYGVNATKSIQANTTSTDLDPAIQYDGDSRIATVTLTGQPTGNVRSTDMVFEDITPSFWNAFNFVDFSAHTFAAPLDRVKVDALVGVTYVVTGNLIEVWCGATQVLDDCWREGTFGTTLQPLALQPGETVDEVRGLRFHYTRDDGAAWERPFNPLQTVRFTVERRETLVEPEVPETDVPSTLYLYTQAAPGEDEPGLFTNRVDVEAYVDDVVNGVSEGWGWRDSDFDVKQLRYQHRPAEVRVIKTPRGDQLLGATIPFKIEITNLGTGQDKDLAKIEIVDTLPADGTVPMLEFADDPENDLPYDPNDAITLVLRNASGVAVAPPSFDATLGAAANDEQPLTIVIDPAFVLPKQWTLTANVPMQFRPQFPAGSGGDPDTGALEVNVARNTATVVTDQPFDRCEFSEDGVFDDAFTEFVETCSAYTRVWASPSAPMSIIKGVRGVEAGPLDSNGDPLLDGSSQPYDDLGVLRANTANINCETASFTVAAPLPQDYYRFPCVPITRPGGREEWVASFFNAGNVEVKRVVAIDVLPRAGDRGIIINQARSSRWSATLLQRPRLYGAPASSTMTVYYTDRPEMTTVECNGADIQNDLGMDADSPIPMLPQYQECITQEGNGGLDDRNGVDGWQVMPDLPTTDPTMVALLESVTALKFVIDLGEDPQEGLSPGDTITVAYETRTAIEPDIRESNANLARNSIAYNSIAGAARGIDRVNDLPYRFVLEPRKAGVALAMGAIELEKLMEGPGAASFAPDTVDINVACAVDIDGPGGAVFAPQPIELRTVANVNRSPFTITGDAAPTRIVGIPLYAECDISEVLPTGAVETTIDNPTVRALLIDDVDPTQVVFNEQPAFGTRAPLERSELTNTYELASLVVTKSVEMNDAENESNNPVMQSGFEFSIGCTFDNGSGALPISVSPSTFTLNDGDVQTFSDLPAGAVCTIVEEETREASVSTVITTGGSSSQPDDETAIVTLSADTELGAPTNSVAYTNSIAVGSLEVEKAITGAGAQYGDGVFTVRVSCIREGAAATPPTPGAPANSVYFGTFQLDNSNPPASLTRTIDNLPAGSDCTISETVNAGASNVSYQPSNTVEILGGETAERTVTNRFDLASLRVGKTVLTEARDADGNLVYPEEPFLFSVACMFQGDPVFATGFTESPMTFPLEHNQTRTLSGLPAGANCSVTETDDRDADSTVISRVAGNSTATVSINPANPWAQPTTTIVSLVANGGTVQSPVTRNSTQFTNSYGVATLILDKNIIGGGGTQFAPESFTVNVVCTSPLVGESFNGNVTVPANGSETINNLADNSTCRVSELVPEGVDAHRILDEDGAVVSSTTDVLVTRAAVRRLTVENYYMTGSLEVTKTVIGEGRTFGVGPFEVTLACTRGGEDVIIEGGATRDIERDLAGDFVPVTYTLLPSGALCTLTETGPAGAVSSRILDEDGDELTTNVATGYSFTVDVAENQFVLVDNQAQPDLQVENTFELASLSITKTVVSDAVNEVPTAIEYGPFPVLVTCTFPDIDSPVYATGYSAGVPMQRDLDDGAEPWVLSGLPEGAQCRITETNTMDAVETRIVTQVDGGGTSTISADTAVVTLRTSTMADIQNDYTVGSIQLSKSVVGPGAADWADAPFEIDVTCVLDDSTRERTVFDDSFTFVRGDGPVTIENLATGSLCSITETATGGASSTSVTIDGSTVDGLTAAVTVADEPIDVTVTNTFALGEVRVEKRSEGDGAATWGAGPFEVELTCERTVNGDVVPIGPNDIPDGPVRALTTTNSYTETYEGLPLDAVCSLVETRSAGATSTSIDVDEVTVSAEPVAFRVTNTFDVGRVEVEKTFVGDGTGLFVRGSFEATLACTLDIDGERVDLEIPDGATRELTQLRGYRETWEQIPAGAECTVTESRTGGATSTVITAGKFVVVADDVHTVTIENSFMLAAFSITKELAGPFAFEARDATFLIETSCLWERDGEMVPMLPGDWWLDGADGANGADRGNEVGGDAGSDPADPADPADPTDPTDPVDPPTSVRSEISAGTTVLFENLPAGSRCTISEVDAAGATGQLLWLGGVLQLGDLALRGGANDSTLTNVFLTTLALTGVEIVFALWLVGGLFFLGTVLLLIARRRAAAV